MHGMEGDLSMVKLLGGPELKFIDSYYMQPNEAITSLHCTNKLEDAPIGELIIVGTSYYRPDEGYEQMEAEKGRILIILVSGGPSDERKKLKLVVSLEVDGGVNALGVCAGKVVACVNANNCIYKWTSLMSAPTASASSPPSMGGLHSKGSLQCVCTLPGQTMGVSISTLGKQILVGDLLKSLSLYELDDAAEGVKLRLLMNDVASHYILGASLNANRIMASDTLGNLLRYEEAADPFISNRKVLRVCEGYFLGTPIVKIINQSSGLFVLIGESGQAWELRTRDDDFGVLKRLEEVLAGRLAPLHQQHRMLFDKHPPQQQQQKQTSQIVDGDLLVRFMELPFKEKEEIAAVVGLPAPAISQLLLQHQK